MTGVFRCGPASLKAVKNGKVYLPYDTGFVFAEVNSDRVNWDVDGDDGLMKAGYVDKHSIGKSISTKKPGKGCRRLDVTSAYKHPCSFVSTKNLGDVGGIFSNCGVAC